MPDNGHLIQATLRELHEAGYLRGHDWLATIAGAGMRVDATLYGRTLLAEAVAGAARFHFATQHEAPDYLRYAGEELVFVGSAKPEPVEA